MRTIVLDPRAGGGRYALSDPDAPSETEFEGTVLSALAGVYHEYHCIVFGGAFVYEGNTSRPDLALIARDFSHWFVLEVELVSHSLSRHVLPQVTTLRYGDLQPDCEMILARELKIPIGRAQTLIHMVPRSVAVIANKRDARWEVALGAHTVQMLAVSVFEGPAGETAFEVEGTLRVDIEHLGFGCYSAVDRSLRFPKDVRLPDGRVQIDDPSGAPGSWIVSTADTTRWVTKDSGMPDIEDGEFLQLVRFSRRGFAFMRPRAR